MFVIVAMSADFLFAAGVCLKEIFFVHLKEKTKGKKCTCVCKKKKRSPVSQYPMWLGVGARQIRFRMEWKWHESDGGWEWEAAWVGLVTLSFSAKPNSQNSYRRHNIYNLAYERTKKKKNSPAMPFNCAALRNFLKLFLESWESLFDGSRILQLGMPKDNPIYFTRSLLMLILPPKCVTAAVWCLCCAWRRRAPPHRLCEHCCSPMRLCKTLYTGPVRRAGGGRHTANDKEEGNGGWGSGSGR